MYREFTFWLILILVLITSCNDGPQVQINSECFLPDLSISMQQPIDKLNLDFSIFTDYVDDPSEGYANFNHSDSIFESRIHIFDSSLPDWRVGELSIYRRIEMENLEKMEVEENLNHIKSIWLNCNVPTDTIDMQLENINQLMENDSFGRKEKFYSVDINPRLKEMYSWQYYEKREEGYSFLRISYEVY